MFDFKEGFKKASKLFGGMFAALGMNRPTRNEMRLDSDAYAVKQKLGKAFFTKRLNGNTRVARIMSLTKPEWELARSRGWI